MNQRLEHLRNVEKDILKLGESIGELFTQIENTYNGDNYDEQTNATFNLDDILNKITQTKETMHKEVDKLYDMKSYPNLYKESNDNAERKKELDNRNSGD